MADFPSAVAPLPPLPKYTEQDFLDLFNRLLPDHYLQPLIDPGPGYEMLKAYAAMAARVSEAVEHVGTGNYILSAGAGSYAEGEVTIWRDNTVFGPMQLLPGTIVASADGYTYETLDTVTFIDEVLPPQPTRVRATVRGWLYNKPGPVTCADGSVIPGAVNLLVRPVIPTSGPYANFDPTLQVQQSTDITGGSAPMLQGLGADRGLPMEPTETVEEYRSRLTQLPDTVTPNALYAQFMAIVGNRLNRRGYRWWFIETWDLRVQMCWDAPYNQYIGGAIPYAPVCTQITDFTQNVFAWDYDPVAMPSKSGRAPSGWPVSNRLMDAGEYNSSILIALPYVPELQNFYAAVARTLAAIKPAGISIYYLFTFTDP